MALSKKKKSDLIFWISFVLLAAFLYLTPWGSSTRKLIGELFLSSPAMEKIETGNDNYLTTDWNLKNTNKNEIWISETNKPIFINIWATWCGPCRTEMPSINRLYNKYKNDVDFIMVSPHETIETLKEFAQKNVYSFPTFTAISQTPIQLQTNSYPTTIIIGDNKNIAYKITGAHDWDTEEVYSILDELINK